MAQKLITIFSSIAKEQLRSMHDRDPQAAAFGNLSHLSHERKACDENMQNKFSSHFAHHVFA